MKNSSYVVEAEQSIKYTAQDSRRAIKVVVDTKKLFEKKLQQLTFEQLNGNINFDEQFKHQKELMNLKTKIENFSSTVQAHPIGTSSKQLTKSEKKEMHHLANSGLYNQDEVATIFDTNQTQVSRYKNKPSAYFDDK